MKPTSSSSASIEAEAARWVVRSQAGLDATGEQEFARWRDASPEHSAALRRLGATAEAFQRARACGAAPAIVTGLRVRARRRAQTRALLASCSVAVLGLGLWQWRALTPTEPVAATARPFERLRQLPDGSIVELKPGAEIIVKFDGAKRGIELLRGEALFRVEPDATRPFVVTAEGVDAHAIGTTFNVRLDHSAVAILVTEGKVRVDGAVRDAAGGIGLVRQEVSLIKAGEQVVVAREAPAGAVPSVQVSAVSADEIRSLLAWRLPRFEFDGMELDAALQALNRVNRVQLEIADPRLAQLRISGDFAQDDPETFARLTAATFGLKLQRPGPDRLLLTRE